MSRMRQSLGQGLRFTLHLLRTVEDILGKTTPLGKPDALGLARRIEPRILIQPIVPIVHRIAAKQAAIPPGDHALGADLQSRRHFFECQQALLAQPIIPRFELVFTAETRNDATVESLPTSGQCPAAIQDFHDLLIGVMIGQSINLGDNLCRRCS